MPTQDWTDADDFDTEEDNSGFVHDALADHKTLADGLRAYYPLDTGSGTTATDEAFNNDGTINGATWNGSGKIGEDALSFDGTDDTIDVSPVSGKGSINSGGITISGWINRSAIGVNHTLSAIDTSETGIVLRASDTDVVEAYYNSSGTNPLASGTTTLSSGTWYHLTVTIASDKTITVYVDGSEEGSANNGAALDSPQNNNTLGSEGSSKYFDGLIDDVRIYDRALGADEVTELYNKTEPTQIPKDSGRNQLQRGYDIGSLTEGLTAYYPMENSGSAIVRDGALDNDGQINGATWNGSGQVGDDSLSFDGTDDYVQSPNNILSTSDSFSYSFWTKPTLDGTEDRVIDLRHDNGLLLSFEYNTGQLGLFMVGSTNTWHGNMGSLTNGVWQHIGVTYNKDTNTATAYIDGVQTGTVSDDLSGTGNGNNRIGVDYANNTTAPYDGLVDDVRVYDRLLSEPEIEALYSQTVPDGRAITDSDVPNDTDGGVSHYPFNGDVLDSWGTNDGTDNTSAGYGTGVYGQGKSFDGTDDRVELPNLGLGSSQSFTISTWTRFGYTDADNVQETIVGRYDGTDDILNLRKTVNMGLRWRVGHTGGNSLSIITDDGILDTTSFNHVLGIYDANDSSIQLYLNGSLIGEASGTVDDFAHTDGPWIGARSDSFAWHNGDVDDVRIYDRALSPTEVEQLFELGSHRIARSDTI